MIYHPRGCEVVPPQTLREVPGEPFYPQGVELYGLRSKQKNNY